MPKSTDTLEPTMEWCGRCERPLEMCEGHGPVTAVAVDMSTPVDRTRPAAPGGQELDAPTGRSSAMPSGHRLDVSTRTDRTTTGRVHSDAVDTDWTEPAEPTGQRVDTRSRMTPSPSSDDRSRWQRTADWISEWGALIPIWILAGALGAAGFAVSFFTVEEKMRPHFGQLAWLVPAATDLGIIVFTLLDIVLARKNMRVPWMRYIPWALTAATIYLNVTAYTVLEAQVAHAVLPALWVVFSEAIARIMKQKAKDEQPATRKVPLIRWVCAPVATLILWRAMQLWNIPTYDQALELEEERQLARAVIRDNFGSVRRAPRTLRVRYRQRKITVDEVYEAAVQSSRTGGVQSVSSPRPVKNARPTGQASTPVRSDRKAAPKSVQSDRKPRPAQSVPVQSTPSGSKPGQPRRRVSTRSNGGGSKTKALSEAWAAFQSEGVANPTVRQLADRAGCSTGLAGDFKRDLNKGKKES